MGSGKEAATPDLHEEGEEEKAELVLFHVKECYVYMIPPRKSAASYRADEWNINKWAWEGSLRIVTKGDDCSIRLEDSSTGELYAQAPIPAGQPVPVEPVIDSSRFFVLRIEDNSSGHARHAFIGIGFRERPTAYDFQAAVYDHLNYLDKKKHAEELEQEYQSKPSVDYSLKEGQTLLLNLDFKTSSRKLATNDTKSKFFDQNIDAGPIRNDATSPPSPGTRLGTVPWLAPPPPPPASPLSLSFASVTEPDPLKLLDPLKPEHIIQEDEFGDFQTAS